MSGKRPSRNDPCPCGGEKEIQKLLLPPRSWFFHDAVSHGTVALYGPNDKVTTKIVAGVIVAEGVEAIIERWVGTGVQENPKVRKEIEEFFALHDVKSVAVSDGNMGCPHEEGEDFSVGEACPFCPFWIGKQGSGVMEE